MKLQKNLIQLCSCFIMISFSSYDSRVKYDKYIFNNTEYTLTLLQGNSYTINNVGLNDSIAIDPSSGILLVNRRVFGGDVNGFSDCPFYPEVGDSILVKVVGPDEVLHEFYITENDDWEHFITSEGKGGNGSCECILNIDEEDLPF